MISVNRVELHFGGFELFRGISFQLNMGEKVGLVGRNGAGKTTLLKLLAGELDATRGEVVIPSGIVPGYLPQQMRMASGRTVLDETMQAFAETLQLKQRLDRVADSLATRDDYESDQYLALATELAELNERFSLLDGGSMDARVEQVLLGLGFKRSDFNRPTDEFSGGWRMRIELAKILLQNPKVLLLDEPTNHLDIESIQWLEDYLKGYSGALLLISHDRAFLDNVTDRTIELSLGKLYDYKVPYSKYISLRAERRQQQLAAYRNQQKLIDDTRDFIERFRYKATKAVQVQSRIKMLERMDIIEVEEEDTSSLNIRFSAAPRSGDLVCEAKGVTKRFGDKLVFADVGFTIERGQKVAFVGRNGEGKTTMSRIIIGELDFDGTCRLGHNVSVGYFAQNQDEILDESITVLETIDRVAVGDIRTKMRDILGAFLFKGDDVDKRVKVLSGGERNRLALAKLMLQPYNLLVLDEPTNHLDIHSKEVLKNALLHFRGTLIVVSHDREFLDGLVDKVYEFSDGRVKEHLGGIYDFLRRKRSENIDDIYRMKQRVGSKAKDEPKKRTDQKRLYAERKEMDRKIRKVEGNLKRIEESITELESAIADFDRKLLDPKGSGIDLSDNEVFREYNRMKEQLKGLMDEWESLSMQLDELNEKRKSIV